jgi:sulfite exporter TauE/SafE
MDFVVPFITGLTTGGLSCLAVQGGLLAGSIAHEVEQSVRDMPAQPATRKAVSAAAARGAAQPGTKPAGKPRTTGKSGAKAGSAARAQSAAAQARKPQAISSGSRAMPVAHGQPRAARPIVLFLAAKLVAYTVLGFLLGMLGSVLQLSIMTQAVMQAAIGIFMVGTALRMFNVHPIFRYFSLEPPRFVTRYIRRKAKDQEGAVTPLFLGALTVLIPCGITQAMMAVAIGTSNPVAGAVTMFAFILGTSPVFFLIAYLATRLGSRLEANFMRAVAAVVLVLGLVSINTGLTLAGSPYSFSNLQTAWSTASAEAADAGSQSQTAAAPGEVTGKPGVVYGQGAYAGPPSPGGGASQGGGTSRAGNTVTISVSSGGYSPRVSHARANQAVQLALVTRGTGGCARAFVIPSLRVQKILPPTGTTTIDVPPQKPGSKLYYSCSMGMYNGVIVFDS